jgi:pimeloyl-ACP methyl ester carboxylesterase
VQLVGLLQAARAGNGAQLMEAGMSRFRVKTIGVLVALGCLACVACSVADRKPISTERTAAIRRAEYVSIGGIDQWITIHGALGSNPVILVLHGGPGQAWSSSEDSMFPGWDKDFTLVQWDQRDAGRTFVKNGESVEPTITLERMTQDGIEVAEYARTQLHKQKIILLGGSWGSVLGIRMAHERPDLFSAYVGVAQVTSWQQDVVASYARVREIAQSTGDQPGLDALNAIGPPPFSSIGQYLQFSRLLWPYQAQLATVQDPPVTVASEYASEAATYGPRGAAFSLRYMWRLASNIDITSITDFKIPVFVIQGDADLIVPPDVARAYFETIRAPRKAFYLVPGAGHNTMVALLQRAREVLLTQGSLLAAAHPSAIPHEQLGNAAGRPSDGSWPAPPIRFLW